MGKYLYDCHLGTEAKFVFLLLGTTFFVLIHGDARLHVSRNKVIEVNQMFRNLNRPAVKSIKSEDGDTIDCINTYKQLALEHPALRNHKIQIEPTYHDQRDSTRKSSTASVMSQVWKRSGSCPKGTIPVRRIKKTDILRADSLENYGRKKPHVFHARNNHYTDQMNGNRQVNNTWRLSMRQANHSMGGMLTVGYSYNGAKGDLNVWNPSVEKDDEYSSSQIQLSNGPYYDFESIESGWIVNPGFYGDRQTRLYAYWTADTSKTTGCFDVVCPGFVQTSSEIALGSGVGPLSQRYGTQYQITVYMYLDFMTNNWWLQIGEGDDKITVGYWPAELFGALNHQASFVQWGGDVYSSKVGSNHPHTSTSMGSGLATSMFGWGCYIRNLRIRDNSLALKFPTWFDNYIDEYECYRSQTTWEYMTEPELYFGGPGRNPRCP